MDEGIKNAPKALTANDIREHARDWSLAGDVGLLAHLEQFAESICNRTQETQKQLTELADSCEEVFTNVGNVTNQFLALQNCQFVENRVYDEDTPTEEKEEVKKVPDAAEQEKILLTQYKVAVEAGLKLLDTHFEEVQLPLNSDSDEEDECSTGNSFIWKPKNPYAGKKFPLLIGSSEWWADDNVGLGNLEENMDTEKTISESEGDLESPQINQKMESSSSSSADKVDPTIGNFIDSSSEDLFGLNREDDLENDIFSKGKNSTFGEPQIFSPLFENQSTNVDVSVGKVQVPEEEVIVKEEDIAKPQKVDNDFTKELMAKLASVSNKAEPMEKKREPSEEKPKGKVKEVLFDEPDDSSDLFSGKISHSVRPPNLFFDAENDDELFNGSKNLLFDSGNTFENDTVNESEKNGNIIKGADIKVTPRKDSPILKKPLVNSLFEDVDDEDTLFSSKPVVNKQKNESLPNIENNSFNNKQPIAPSGFEKETTKGLFDDFDQDFENDFKSPLFNNKINEDIKIPKETISKNSRPVDSLKTNNSNDFSIQKPSNPIDSLFESNPSTKHSSSTVPFKEPEEKKISFLDDDDDDLFSSNFKEDSLFREKKSSSAKLSAVDDDDISLFAEKPKQDSTSISSSRSSLFDDVSATKSKLGSVFEKDKNSNLEVDLFNVSNNTLFGETTAKASDSLFPKSNSSFKAKSSLFDDDFDDSDDLFKITKEKISEKLVTEKGKKLESNDLFGEEPKTIKEEILENSIPEKPKAFQSNDLFDEASKIVKEVKISESLIPENTKKIQSGDSFLEEPKFTVQETIMKNTIKEEPKKLVSDNLFGEESKTSVPISIFDDGEDDDLFKTSSSSKLSEKLPEPIIKKENKTDIFEDILAPKPKIFSDIDDAELFSGEKPEPKPKPPTSLSLKKTSEVKPKMVGKLNIPDNLKGKFEAMAKNISTGETRPKEEKKTEAVIKPKEEPDIRAKSEEKNVEASDNSFQPNSNLLKCPSKDRVKIQAKRRPQSRRARQEAIRNSVNFDDPVDPKPETSNIATGVSKDQDPLFASPVTSNPISPSTDEEDYFNVPELDTNFEKEDQSLFKNNLFEATNDTKPDDLFFDSAPVLVPQKNTNVIQDDLFSVESKPTPKKTSIFDDEEDKDDCSLFKNEPSTAPEFTKVPNLFHNQNKKSLFDDEEENELFGGGSINTVSKPRIVPKEKDEEKEKKKGNPGFVDPLGLMSSDD